MDDTVRAIRCSTVTACTDYHLHTPLCHHAEGWPTDYIAPARAAGLAEIGFSEHSPMQADDFDDWRMRFSDLPRYRQEIDQARAQAGPDLPVRLGLECDFIDTPDQRRWLEQLRRAAPWDYWIGSVHYLDNGFPIDDPREAHQWSGADIDDLWQRYWRLFSTAVRTGWFSFMAHPDLIKKFGHRASGDLRRFYEPAVQALTDADVAFEFSTAGWHKPCAEAYPADPFLQLALEAGVPIVISSDAHHPDHVGRDFHRAVRHLGQLGFTRLARFARGERTLYPLPESTPGADPKPSIPKPTPPAG